MTGCDVELMAHHRTCGASPARAFTALCACGHKISGHVCEACSLCRLPGCYACWLSSSHVCPVEFIGAECLCGCGATVSIATRSQTRDHIIKGRPLRYIQGHGRNHARWREREAQALETVLGAAAAVVTR